MTQQQRRPPGKSLTKLILPNESIDLPTRTNTLPRKQGELRSAYFDNVEFIFVGAKRLEVWGLPRIISRFR